MKRVTLLSLSAFLLLGVSGTAFAEVSVGEAEYKENCASCHGVKGKGDGPFAEFLKGGVPSLTTLSKNNNGVFPVERVYKVIDGRADVKAHGSREMPVWGSEYMAESVKKHGPFFGDWYGEEVVNAKILALIDYINKLQEK
jgi:mono/diheme cytochrome c family protein